MTEDQGSCCSSALQNEKDVEEMVNNSLQAGTVVAKLCCEFRINAFPQNVWKCEREILLSLLEIFFKAP